MKRAVPHNVAGESSSARVVVLDRDGTIVIDRGYLHDPDGLELLPGAAAGLRAMSASGHRLVVITNQSGVGRGYFSLQQMEQVNARLAEIVAAAGARLEAIYSCPHAPGAGCSCRKPGVALLLQAAEELGFDAAACIVIGDKSSDVELGAAVGATTILIRPQQQSAPTAPADFVVDDLLEAATLIQSLPPRHASATK